ncbi:MAG: glycosyl hydrolase 53 family protein [Prevotella sp.]|nr:glycosyl hydrolase 53 family protein [Prevotella sp.]
MKRILIVLFVVSCIPVASKAQEEFWFGADISGTTELEFRGERLYNVRGEVRENTALMKELGLNAVRLRVWVNPRGGFSSKEDVLEMAKRARYYNMAVMIDFHYSDWWADPGKQHIPAAWQYMKYDEMRWQLAEHTRETLQLLKDHHIDVRWVQIGNETTHGFLWPMGRAEDNMEQYAGLTEAGYQAAKSVYPDAQCIVHLDGGADTVRYDFIFDGLRQYGVHWDMIGMSVYPYWDIDSHITQSENETLEKVVANIKRLYRKYGKELMIVETGVEAKRPKEGKAFMKRLLRAAKNDTDGHCKGVFYWAPELEGQYPLGAFDNHRPTIIMDAFTEEANR